MKSIFDKSPIICLLLALFRETLCDDPSSPILPTVVTSYGTVAGVFKNGAAVFLGIPYAKPPINDLHFKKPEKPNAFNGTFKADHYGSKCLTLPTVDQERASSDCLYINVFSDNLKGERETLSPVVVLIHGGNYETGSSESFSERGLLKNFVSKGVVVVTFNYRLNFYGFFTTMTDDFPPNLGLWDQLRALTWVREEIHNFGGNPWNITLVGHGYGASSVALHLHSPHSAGKGLFKRAVIQSGSTFSPFALAENRYKIESSKVLAVSLKCCNEKEFETKNFTADFARCIKTVDQGKIWQILLTNFTNGSNHDSVYQSVWAPVIDEDFVTKSLKINISDFQVLIGSTANEKAISELTSDKFATTKQTFDLAAANLARPEAFPKSFRLINDLMHFVYDETSTTRNSTSSYLDKKIAMSSDYWMNAGIAKEVRLLAEQNSTVYLYSFEYTSNNLNYFNKSENSENFQHDCNSDWSVHGMDAALLYPGNETLKLLGLPPWTFGKKDKQMQNITLSYWLNFIKTGNPNHPDTTLYRWTPVDIKSDADFPQYMALMIESQMKPRYSAKADRLWNWLVPRMTDPIWASSTTSEDIALILRDDLAPNSTNKTNIYTILTWVLIVIVILAVLIYFITFTFFRRKLRTYQFLRRVEELNFT